jgi:hypothetical protein
VDPGASSAARDNREVSFEDVAREFSFDDVTGKFSFDDVTSSFLLMTLPTTRHGCRLVRYCSITLTQCLGHCIYTRAAVNTR